MPTYEYRCTSCGEHLEVVQSFRDDALTSCPVCGGPLRKVFGSIGVVFKGSGFYKTDSRSAAKGSKDAKPAASESSGDASGASKTKAASSDASSGGAKEGSSTGAKEGSSTGAKEGSSSGGSKEGSSSGGGAKESSGKTSAAAS
jgi:putative FmdB family regulatory protein